MALPTVTVNWIAVIVAAVAANIIGAIWYGPLFGKAWMALTGMKMQPKGGMGKGYALNFGMSLITAFFLAYFVSYASAATFFDALQLGLFIGVGFIATVMFGSVIWEKRPLKLYFIGVFYQLISLVVMAWILAAWP